MSDHRHAANPYETRPRRALSYRIPTATEGRAAL